MSHSITATYLLYPACLALALVLAGPSQAQTKGPSPTPPSCVVDMAPMSHWDRNSSVRVTLKKCLDPADGAFQAKFAAWLKATEQYQLWAAEIPIGRAVHRTSLPADGGAQWVFRLRGSLESVEKEEKERLAMWEKLSALGEANLAISIGTKPDEIKVGSQKVFADPVITNVEVAGLPCTPTPCVVRKGSILTLSIANWNELMKRAKADTVYLLAGGKSLGMLLPGPTSGDKIQFELTADGAGPQRERLLSAWRSVMAVKGYDDVPRMLSVGTTSLVLAGSADGIGSSITIRRLNESLWIWGLFMLVLLGVLVGLGAEGEILREPSPQPVAGARQAFSLNRCQMAWWFLIAVGSVSFYWAILGEELTIPPNLLALLGISGATGFLGYTVDEVDAKNLEPIPTEGWWKDVLTSRNGVEMHRLQMLVWTILFGIMVVYEFATTLQLPDPSNGALVLMGLSSGLYVGLKVPEKKA